MTESLYYLALSYLRENYQLINFTKLNNVTGHDMFEILKNPLHLSTVTVCRRVYNWKALYCYIVKYCKGTKYVEDSGFYNDSCIITIKKYWENPVDELYIDPHWNICDLSTGRGYRVINVNLRAKKYRITSDEFIKNNIHLFRGNFGDSILCESIFSEILDAIKPACQQGYISDKIFIYNDLIQKLQC
ncbi:Hypothetical protein PACV_371 [Pacmanvirus A23]|uniref:Hypothetical protein n=1 Tax=Pacmanvirus A23 TaxID=1932881 RepID=UPI000A095C24|nr:Hypothetical protein B9W72_gp367 [Pacmanvirus A23]SIP86084.1 Hypothetical protein PACV_371 [Pacmanvirus A23]